MSRFGKLCRRAAVAALAIGGAGPAAAQDLNPRTGYPDAFYPSSVYPVGHTRPAARTAACPPGCTAVPCYPPAVPTAPGMTPGMTPPGTLPETQPPAATVPNLPSDTAAPSFAGLDGGAGLGQTVAAKGAYIENAVPVTMFRLRFDSSYGNNRPDRAEFFYAKCGCFQVPNAKGPPLPETSVDSQELTPYFEYAVNDRFSVFADIPVRFINPEQNRNETGLSDVSFGAKYAFIRNEQRVVSLWLRTITPSGGTREGLGTGNWWIEPGLLYLEQLSDRWQVFGEFRDQIHLSRQSDFTGNVLRYGLGTSYIVADGNWGYAAPVAEFVGWTALSGKETDASAPGSVESASGDTIVNAKFGLRIGLGQPQLGQFFATPADLYIGYARAITGEVWYKDMLRIEFRKFF